MKKNSTVFMVVGGNQTASDVTKVSPFPTLDPIYGAAFPLYDFNEELVSNSYQFRHKLRYVSDAQNAVRFGVILMSSLAALCLILGIIAVVVYKMADKEPRNESDTAEDAGSNPALLD